MNDVYFVIVIFGWNEMNTKKPRLLKCAHFMFFSRNNKFKLGFVNVLSIV